MEQRQKYYKPELFKLKAEAEHGGIPHCFDKCVDNMDAGLNAAEKNCMHICYYRHIGITSDTNMLTTQLLVDSMKKALLEEDVWDGF